MDTRWRREAWSPRPADRQTDKAGRSRAGPGRGRGRLVPRRAGKEGPGGLREGEGSGGAGRARGAGRGQEAGRGGGAGASGKTPQLPAPPEPGSGSRDAGPGIAEPDLGHPAGHLPAELQVHDPGPAWPPAPRLPGEVERRREGAGALPAVLGPPPRPSEPAAAPPWASVNPSVKGSKERRTNTCRVPSKWG